MALFDYQEIKGLSNFLGSKGYTFLRKRVPDKSDWKKSPFEKPPLIRVSLVSIKILGFPVSLKDEEFFIVEAKKDGKFYFFWIKVVRGIFSKTKFYMK